MANTFSKVVFFLNLLIYTELGTFFMFSLQPVFQIILLQVSMLGSSGIVQYNNNLLNIFYVFVEICGEEDFRGLLPLLNATGIRWHSYVL